MSNSSKMPPMEELERRYGAILDCPGFASARDRSDPSPGKTTDAEDDARILASMDGEDEDALIQGMKAAARRSFGL